MIETVVGSHFKNDIDNDIKNDYIEEEDYKNGVSVIKCLKLS